MKFGQVIRVPETDRAIMWGEREGAVTYMYRAVFFAPPAHDTPGWACGACERGAAEEITGEQPDPDDVWMLMSLGRVDEWFYFKDWSRAGVEN
jgi:hypothetical protein